MEGTEVVYQGCTGGTLPGTADGYMRFDGQREGDSRAYPWNINMDWVESHHVDQPDPAVPLWTVTIIYHDGMEPESEPEN